MRYNENEALGFIETVGMTPALEGTDKMLKAASVSLVAYENIGSTLVSVIVTGDVGAVKSSVEAGAKAAASIGTLTAQNVIPRPISAVSEIARVHDVDAQAIGAGDDISDTSPMHGALGSIETFGLVFVLEAADAMAKAAEVEVIGYENTASGYISVLIGGDVAACTTAVAAGVKAVEEMGAEVYSSVVIARPHYELKKIISQYSLDNLLPANTCEPAPAATPSVVAAVNEKVAEKPEALPKEKATPAAPSADTSVNTDGPKK